MKYLLVSIAFILVGIHLAAQPKPVNIQRISAKEVKEMIDTSTGPLIINFWASWCGPCTREIPYFEAKVARSPVAVKVVLVSLDFPGSYPKQLNAFVQQKGYKSEVLYLIETDSKYFIPVIDTAWSGAIPASIFVDNSKKYYRFFNMQLTEPRFDLELKNLLQ